jgi:hypothetical protein
VARIRTVDPVLIVIDANEAKRNRVMMLSATESIVPPEERPSISAFMAGLVANVTGIYC